MRWSRKNWLEIFSYGEVICFASAWLVTLLMAYATHRPTDDSSATRSFAINAEVSGMQATRHR